MKSIDKSDPAVTLTFNFESIFFVLLQGNIADLQIWIFSKNTLALPHQKLCACFIEDKPLHRIGLP